MRKKDIGEVGVFCIFILILGFWGFPFIPYPGEAFAEQKSIVIRYAHAVPETIAPGKQARVFEKCIKEKSNEKVAVEIYPAAQLFTFRDLFPAVRRRAVEIAVPSIGMIQGSIPLMGIFELPFLFQNHDQVTKTWDGYTGEIFKQEFEKSGVKLLAAGHHAFIQISNSKREIRTPKDLKGLKIRVIGPTTAEVAKIMGAAPIVLGGDEAYLALARKTADGSVSGLDTFAGRKYYEVQKYASVINICITGTPIFINLEFWNGLPEEVRTLIQQCAKESQKFVLKQIIEDEEDALKIVKEKGMIVYTPTPAEMKEFQEACAPVIETWIKRNGDVAEKMVKFVENLK